MTCCTSIPSAVPRISFAWAEAMLMTRAGFTPGTFSMRFVSAWIFARKVGVKTLRSCGKSPTTIRFLSPNVAWRSFSAWM